MELTTFRFYILNMQSRIADLRKYGPSIFIQTYFHLQEKSQILAFIMKKKCLKESI